MMLTSIFAENFKSFEGPTEMTMISSNKIRGNSSHRAKIKSKQLLKFGVVYGANASGKSNLVDFFRFFKECVQGGLPITSAQMFCKNHEENIRRDSTFEIRISIGDKFYAYGFSSVLNKRSITKEWLNEIFQNGTERSLFERIGKGKPAVCDGVRLTKKEQNRFEVYAKDFEGSDTSLFLTEMNRGKKYESGSGLIFFKEVYEWIQNHIFIVTSNTPLVDFVYGSDGNSPEMLVQLLQKFNTGICNVKMEEVSLDKLSKAVPRPVFDRVMQVVKTKIEEMKNPAFRITLRSNESFYSIVVKDSKVSNITTIRLDHEKTFYDFSFEEESDGTRRLFDLMDMLLNKQDDIVYIADELEKSLHPKLTEHFLKQFMELHDGQRIQLIFTTQESAIMDQSLFRRDEIWFVERDKDNRSRIYSLDHFKERYDKVLSKAYLEGRYGAIPVFSSFDFKKSTDKTEV